MTKRQQELLTLISFQRKVLEKLPGDHVEEVTFDTLVTELRGTFAAIKGGKEEQAPQYAYSPSRAVLKRVQ